MAINLKIMEKETHTLQDQEYGANTDKRGKSETHMVGPGLWREKGKTWKMRKKPLYDLEYAKKLKNEENQKCTLQDLEHGQKQ